MNDYKELIELNRFCIGGSCSGCKLEGKPTSECFKAMEDMCDALEQTIRERNAAVADISWLIVNGFNVCKICKHNFSENSAEYCLSCCDTAPGGNFTWRGVQE